MQTYDTPADFRDTIVAARGEPPAGVPADVPVLLDLAYGSRPDAEALHQHWERAARVRRPVVLAGSLDPGNVAEAIAVAHPWAVDTSRGVEAAPGVKDHDLRRARSCAQRRRHRDHHSPTSAAASATSAAASSPRP